MRTNNMCPTGPEFQALVNHPGIGKFEAVRDWMEHDGEIRTVNQVLQKLAMKRDGGQPTRELLKFLNGFGFEIEESENLIINLAAKKITVNPNDPAQMAKALAAPLAEMLSYRDYFYDIQKAIRKSSRYKEVWERIEKEFYNAFVEKNGPEVKISTINRLATKEIFRELLEKGFNEKFAKEAGITKPMLERIMEFIRQLAQRIMGVDWFTVTRNIDNIVENTFKGSDFIRVTEKEGYKKVAFQEAFNQNDIAKDIMTKIGTDPRIVLTGSIAYSTQGTVYRKIESVVHDLDFVNQGLTSEEIENMVMSNYPDAMRAYTFFDKYLVETYLIPPKGLRIQNLVRRPNGTKIIGYELVDEKGDIVGTYKLNYDVLPSGKITNEEEVKTGREAMLVDFFTNDTMERETLKHDFIGSDGKKYSVNLSRFEEPFAAKLSYSRFKDIWDYNRFIPNDLPKYVPGTSNGISDQSIEQDDKSYYRGQIERPTIDKDGNLVLIGVRDSLYERAGLPSTGVSMTTDLQSAIEYGNGQIEVAKNMASDEMLGMDLEREFIKLDENGYYLIQIPKNFFNDIVKEAGEVKIIGNKLIIPKGQYKIEQVIDEDVETQTTGQPSTSVTDAMVEQMLPFTVDVESTEYTRANEIARKLMAGLSSQTNLDYEVVTPQEAAEMTKGSRNPYNGEPAFFFNGKAYFVNGRLNTLSVFHEFAHPILRQISRANPELFSKLYANLIITPEGIAIVKQVAQNYPELVPGTMAYMEEVMATVLGLKADKSYNALKTSNLFDKVVNEIMYFIKQMLRKVFGRKVDVSKLDQNTTLEDLAQMLVKGGNFTIDVEAVTDKDVVAYQREQTSQVNDLAKVAPERLREIAKRGFETAKRQINLIKKNKNYREMLNVLADEFNRGDLNAIKENLAKYAAELESRMDELLERLDYNQSQSEAVINTYYRLQQVFTKIEEHMRKMASDSSDPRNNMQKAFYYNGLVKYWQGFIQESLNIINSTPGITKDNELYKLVGGLDAQARSINDIVQQFYSEGVRDTLMTNLRPMAINMQQRFDSIMDTLTRNGASQSSRDRQYKEFYGMTESEYKRFSQLRSMKEAGTLGYQDQKEYDRLKQMNFKGIELTEEKLEEILKGRLGDVSWANSFLEGVLYNDDPVMGGFGLYVSNAMNEVMTKAQMKYNTFANAIREDLEKVGYNPTNIGELGQKVGFLDTIAVFDSEQEKMVEKKIWTFLNPWKEYRAKIDIMEDDVRNARRQWLQTGKDADKKALIDAIERKRVHDNKYMHQEYVTEYYEFRDKHMRDETGKKAFFERDNILEDIRSLQEKTPESDMFMIQDQVDELWRKYKLLHSLYDKDGYKKVPGDPDPYKNLEIAQRLQSYSKGSRKFYKYVERPGYFDNALIKFKQSLLNRGLNPNDPNDAQAQSEMQRWFEMNMRVVVKPEFYQKRQEILEKIGAIMAKYPERQADAQEMQKAWDLIFDNVAAFRDGDNQPNATLMSEGRIANVKAAQEYISNLRDDAAFGNQMDEEDLDELSIYFEELADLQTKKPTEYYIDQVNRFIKTINSPLLQAEIGMNYLDSTNIDILYKPEILEELVELSPEFAEWFKNNHIMKTKRNARGQYIETFERLYVWNVIVPRDPAYYESYDIKDENGDVIETLPMVPSTRYYARVIKEEYRTGYVAPKKAGEKGKVKLDVGVHIDNKGNWLPRMDVKDSPYRNEEYYRMQKEDPDMFNLLEKLKKFHLEHQKGLSGDAKLYLDFPRFEKSGLESMRTRNKLGNDQDQDELTGENWFQWLIRRIKDFFRGSKDMPESGFNQSDEFRMATLDMFDNETTKVPMQGLYNIDWQDTSTDITNGMLRYMLAAERNKKLVEITPTARALQSVLENNNLKDLSVISKQAMLNRGEITYANSKEKYLRKKFIDELIEREFEGQYNAGPGADNKFLHNLSQGLFQTASLGFFALNVPSALKNWFGAKYQGMIESAAGRYFNMKDFAAAEAWSMKTMMEVSAQIYKQGSKSKDVQIWEIFNPIQNLEAKFQKEGLSRSLAKDVSNMSWLMNFRKWTEIQASMQMFGAYMKRQQVETKDGKKMDYLDAWEVNDQGQIQLKAEVKPEYGITYDQEGNQVIGDVFRAKQQEIQAVLRNLQGAYDSFNQPLAQRYLAFRFISYLRRFFTTMFIDRFGTNFKNGMAMSRLQPGLGNATEGWYVTMGKFFADVFRSGPKRFTYLLPDEKRAFLKFTTDVAAIYIMTLLQGFLFDWDPDDEERYEKLRQKSGAMRAPFVTDDEYEFKLGGWLSNHALNLLIQTQAEQYQFMPIPGLGLKQYMEFTDLSSIVFGPTIQNYATIMQDLVYLGLGDKRAYYQAEVGPYSWQQDGGLKFLAHTASGFGVTGTFWAPEQALKNYMSIQGKK